MMIFMDGVADLGKRIERLRLERGIEDRAVLARIAGVSYHLIYKLETGRGKEPQMSTITKLAEALDVPVEVLLGREREAVRPSVAGDARLEGGDINLLAIKEIDQEEFQMLLQQLADRRAKLERERKEERSAQRRRSKAAKQAGSQDIKGNASPGKPSGAGVPDGASEGG